MTRLSAGDITLSDVGPLLIDAKGLAKLLACSVRSVWRLRSSGTLPPSVRLGKRIRWDRRDIERWLEGLKKEVNHD